MKYPTVFSRSFGFEELFDKVLAEKMDTYPPYNLATLNDDTYELDVAVSGFTKEELTVQVQKDLLVIEGKKSSLPRDVRYIHKGIGTRSFKLVFPMQEHIRVDSSELLNGILSVKLIKIVPEEMKPKVIEIK